ncbi:fimbrial protein [Pantoea agglomerans]|uniref:Type 1 fimbrial protein n=1 Tax=Enterobacter agglomerans TaxID=549 RepID=A0ACC5RN36_ENTAG|nr:fimbrial protein [Pantoea agglomerans]MBK4726008.1 type 1 fimbrial protein [Pantoea agglomerans]
MEKMKFLATALALSLTASYSYAADLGVGQGKVTFNGKLIAETCQLEDGMDNIMVTLPTLSTQTLAVAGATGGSKVFEIKVKDCGKSIKKVAAHFEAIGSTGVDPKTGNLENKAVTVGEDKPATGVQIRLYNSDAEQNQLLLGDTGESFTVETGKATMRYYGGYYATAQTTAGLVTATAMYTLSYP